MAVLGVTCLAALALSVSSTSSVPGDVPNDLDADLAALPAGSPIINDYSLGGWLRWRHPGIQTVVDGFTDGYTPAAIGDYAAAHAVEAGWEDYVAQTGAESALLRLNSPLATALVDRLGWEAVGSDEGYVLLRAP